MTRLLRSLLEASGTGEFFGGITAEVCTESTSKSAYRIWAEVCSHTGESCETSKISGWTFRKTRLDEALCSLLRPFMFCSGRGDCSLSPAIAPSHRKGV